MGALTGRQALVTGGASGIGRAVVRRFVSEGAKVCVFDRSEAGLQRLDDEFGGDVITVQGDASVLEDNVAAVERMVDSFGGLDILVANAGIFDDKLSLEAMEPGRVGDAFDQLFGVNVKGYLFAAKAALPSLRSEGGSIVFTASTSSYSAGGGGPLYTASKHAVLGLVRQLAFELAPEVRVNGVAPGYTRTNLDGVGNAFATEGWEPPKSGSVNYLLPETPDPDTYEEMYLLLVDEARSATVTGEVFRADRGVGVF